MQDPSRAKLLINTKTIKLEPLLVPVRGELGIGVLLVGLNKYLKLKRLFAFFLSLKPELILINKTNLLLIRLLRLFITDFNILTKTKARLYGCAFVS